MRFIPFAARQRFGAFALVAALLAIPGFAFASEENVVLKFAQSDMVYLGISFFIGLVSIGAALFFRSKVLAQSPGDEKMQEVGHAIRDGAIAYLKQQIGTMVGFVVALAIGLFLLNMGDSVGTGIGVALAFVLGVVPLALATGAGAGARQSMGTGVLGGMLLATFVATIFIPLFFVLLTRRKAKRAAAAVPAAPETAA